MLALRQLEEGVLPHGFPFLVTLSSEGPTNP
jgi:hypothetical protein